jgi:hypothetical protein
VGKALRAKSARKHVEGNKGNREREKGGKEKDEGAKEKGRK